MTLRLPATPECRAALSVAEVLREAGFVAYFAGGCVRDLLLGRTPTDVDVATSALPDEVVRVCSSAGFRTVEVGAHFGVILVKIQEADVEVATFRHDGVYLDGRRPEAVRFSLEAREDVARRDFTINGMLLDPRSIADGIAPEESVLDFVGGRSDLRGGLIRTIGSPEERFGEDKLRMLRGVRFAARFGFRLEAGTLSALRRHAEFVKQVSPERIRDELTRMLTEGRPRAALELLDDTGLLLHTLPEVAKLKGVEQPPEYHPEGDVWTHTLLLLDKLPADASCELAWGFLLHDIGKPATFQPPDPRRPGDRIRFNGHVEVGVRIAQVMLNRLRFSNESQARIVSLIKHHMQFGDVKSMKESTLKRFIRMPRFDEHLALHRADCLSAHGDLRLYEFANDAYLRDEPKTERPGWLVTGRELIAAGYEPGTAFKAMLRIVEDAQLEGRIRSAEEGMALVAHEFGLPARKGAHDASETP